MTDDDYRDLIDAAHNALRDLLIATEPGTGLKLHEAMQELRAMTALIEHSESSDTSRMQLPRGNVDQAQRDADNRQHHEKKEAWRWLPFYERERSLLEVIGDDCLSVAAIDDAFREAFTDVIVYQSGLSRMLRRMVDRGELDRVKAPSTAGGPPCWTYFRRTDLAGPIADLNRQITGDQEGAA
jgi:hypothetical protein